MLLKFDIGWARNLSSKLSNNKNQAWTFNFFNYIEGIKGIVS